MVQRLRTMRWRMSSAGIGATTTLLASSPSGQAAIPVKSDTRFILVLGGGGMKGLAHIGVLQALTERGLLPTHIVGTSVGALVGAAWSAGHSVAELREIAVALRRKDIFAVAHADMAFKRMRSPALFRREPLDTLLERLVGDITFQQLDHPLVVNTVDVNSGMQVFWGLEGLDDITVREAVFASCALPGFLPPREIRGRFYVDGAALDHPNEWPRPGDAGVYPKRSVIVRVQRERCIGCGACLVQAPPGMFVLDAQGKAVVTRPEQEWSPVDGEFIRHCPTYAISARPAAAPKAAGAAG